jgi:phosphoglucosamine mutase
VAKLFGTDGIRGEAYAPPLDRATVQRVGRALAEELSPDAPRVLIGRDTRSSGADLENWLATGIAAGGGASVSAGVLPTPAVAFLTKEQGFDAGVVISASHNPYRDNGIKVFSATGVKSSEAFEEAIEFAADADANVGVGASRDDPEESRQKTPSLHLEGLYLEHLKRSLGDDTSLPPLKLALDCANGACYRVGPKLLESIGLEPILLATEPDGANINRDCGSTHLEGLAETVKRHACDFGAALDGDGDRLLLVDSKGRSVNGDAMLLMCAKRLKKEGRLAGSGVVATVMSNMALEVSLAREDITLFRTQVGDKFVAQDMDRRNIIIGGEQSGHLIFSDYAATGDGLLTLMQVLRTIAIERESLDQLAQLEPFPQVLVNVAVSSRPDVRTIPEIARTIEAAETKLDGRGRVLIRYSGTEPLLRIMMEGPDSEEIETLTATVQDAVEGTIGSSRD